MIGETIKWRVKIINTKGWMFLGIGLRKVLTNRNFLVDPTWNYDKHGCYVVSSIGYSYTYLDQKSNGNNIVGFSFEAGDIVRL